MKQPKPSDFQRYRAELRKAKPIKRLTREQIAELEHKRNLARYLGKRV